MTRGNQPRPEIRKLPTINLFNGKPLRELFLTRVLFTKDQHESKIDKIGWNLTEILLFNSCRCIEKLRNWWRRRARNFVLYVNN